MSYAVFPGSFDPPSYGHLNLIERAVTLFDTLDVVIAVHGQKASFLNVSTRVSLLRKLIGDLGLSMVKVVAWDGIMVEYCKEVKAGIILRGLRAFSDYSNEYELAMINKQLASHIETVFLPSEKEFFIQRSSHIRELLRIGASISSMVPPEVEKVLKNYKG